MHGRITDHLIKAIAITAEKSVIGIKVVLIIAMRFTLEVPGSSLVNAKSEEDAIGLPSALACSRENSADI